MQVYSIENSPLCLTGTAEVPLAGIYMDQILSEAQLPIKMVAFGHAFRTEAGASGASSRGLYRVHQFSKVSAHTLTGLYSGFILGSRELNSSCQWVQPISIWDNLSLFWIKFFMCCSNSFDLRTQACVDPCPNLVPQLCFICFISERRPSLGQCRRWRCL